MGRKNSMDTRLDSFNKQWDRRRYEQRQKANSQYDDRTWADYLFEQIQSRNPNVRKK
jgi:hypothetical protein